MLCKVTGCTNGRRLTCGSDEQEMINKSIEKLKDTVRLITVPAADARA